MDGIATYQTWPCLSVGGVLFLHGSGAVIRIDPATVTGTAAVRGVLVDVTP
jgi:hypothetical protein